MYSTLLSSQCELCTKACRQNKKLQFVSSTLQQGSALWVSISGSPVRSVARGPRGRGGRQSVWLSSVCTLCSLKRGSGMQWKQAVVGPVVRHTRGVEQEVCVEIVRGEAPPFEYNQKNFEILH